MDDAGTASTDSRSFRQTGCNLKEPNMNKIALSLVAAASLFAAGASFADDITPDDTAQALSLKSRADVQAELVKARADGSIRVWSTSYNPLTVAKSLRSRDEVRAEAAAANRAGYDAQVYGEDSGSFAMNRVPASRVAAPVYAGTPARAAQ